MILGVRNIDKGSLAAEEKDRRTCRSIPRALHTEVKRENLGEEGSLLAHCNATEHFVGQGQYSLSIRSCSSCT